MKKQGILNSEIASVLARMGHTDTIVIADCGLPIPDDVKRIDIALTMGTPGFLETLQAVADDMQVEEVTLAQELKENEAYLSKVLEAVPGTAQNMVSHETFKELTKNAKAVIRTGETTPYANIILHAGVIF
ncbi:D-ribose pyranase [Fictibacillus sp. WQ 8-8]|uniref:D-ribose pyranase n=1 Tax=unclassified Fictibacillus TaxID=2644029 RepID=UPI000785A597|nr:MULTISPECIES: D-ribose pyranase [unclassified Fictibacillus]MCQ6264760.1 D-ribose pyranase [Fictibacillus sp. WQ 8-8]MED2972844.1 D-ribose pyranase [Fictibacillus sp. B-59209]UZJ79316.1 D-ribose pyranase [Fictibacillus sp. KU28468]